MSPGMTEPATTFPVCTFKRVFDTTPAQEVLTLSELVASMRRFELKPQLHARIERELGRIDRALELALAGERVGERVATIAAADGALAMRAKAEELRLDARREAKRDLRLWSPVLYRDGWPERGSDGVTHVSCLVLDYDQSIRVPDAIAPFEQHFLLWHSTWSHSPSHPKLRVVLPLAHPVPAAEWDKVWRWAYERSAGDIDRAMSGVGTTYALPATWAMDAPREAGSHAAPLLDPRSLGVDIGVPPRLAVRHLVPSVMLGDPEKEYVVHGVEDGVHVYDDPSEDDFEDRITAPAPPPSMRRAAGPHAGAATGRFGPGAASSPASEAPLEPASLLPSDAPASRATMTSAPGRPAPLGVRSGLPGPPSYSPAADAPAPESLPAPAAAGRVAGATTTKRRRPSKRATKKTIVVDFDGVIHGYSSGWKGATVISDPPVSGAIEWLGRASERFQVAVWSARSREKGGIDAMREWLLGHGLPAEVLAQLAFPRGGKPAAHVYLDDRAVCFEGVFPTLETLEAFEPWHRRKR